MKLFDRHIPYYGRNKDGYGNPAVIPNSPQGQQPPCSETTVKEVVGKGQELIIDEERQLGIQKVKNDVVELERRYARYTEVVTWFHVFCTTSLGAGSVFMESSSSTSKVLLIIGGVGAALATWILCCLKVWLNSESGKAVRQFTEECETYLKYLRFLTPAQKPKDAKYKENVDGLGETVSGIKNVSDIEKNYWKIVKHIRDMNDMFMKEFPQHFSSPAQVNVPITTFSTGMATTDLQLRHYNMATTNLEPHHYNPLHHVPKYLRISRYS